MKAPKPTTPDAPTITVSTMRRFILGKQGLWPGRRWQGKPGVVQTIHDIGAIQVDPVVVVARNHDLKLYSRVIDYEPDQLQDLLYKDHRFFDYGNLLHIYPMEELPYWKLHMQRQSTHRRWVEFMRDNKTAFDHVRSEIRSRGPLGQRDIELADDKIDRVQNYRAGKNTGLAMYCLWLSGEFMTAKRRSFDRIYDFAENIAPKEHLQAATESDSEAYFLRKALKMHALSPINEWRGSFAYLVRRLVASNEIKSQVAALVESGEVTALKVEGKKDLYYVFTSDLPIIETLEAGKCPEAWTPLDSTTDTEVNFLAPLDLVSARGRAAKLFDFDYKWEIYTPAPKQKWGSYVLPILYGHDLVGRMNVKLDRPNKTMLIKGFWLEDSALGKDGAFAAALGRGLIRFTRFHGANKLDASTIQPAGLRAAKLFKGSEVTRV